VLKAFAALGHARRAIDERSDQLKEAATRANLIHTWYFSGVEWMAAIPVALVLLVGGLMANTGQLGIPDLVLFVFLTTQLYRPSPTQPAARGVAQRGSRDRSHLRDSEHAHRCPGVTWRARSDGPLDTTCARSCDLRLRNGTAGAA